MGPSGDPLAVLDSRLRVRGIEGLRVCDLSAMPDINAGNTNAPAMMLGSRCADFITGLPVAKQPFPPATSEDKSRSEVLVEHAG